MKARIRNCLVTLLLTLNYKTLIEQNDQSHTAQWGNSTVYSLLRGSHLQYSSNGVLRILANNGILRSSSSYVPIEEMDTNQVEIT